MFTLHALRKFHGWTHACVSLLLDHLATLPPAQYTKEVPGFGSATVQRQVLHIFNCEGSWIHVLQGLSYRDRTPEEFGDVPAARQLQKEVSERTLMYLSGLSDSQLNSETELHFSDGDMAVRTPALVLHHVLTHAFHHKGQVVAMCRLLGYPAPDTDLNQFV
jgi:uncharacterized damage-inducible protein DinB